MRERCERQRKQVSINSTYIHSLFQHILFIKNACLIWTGHIHYIYTYTYIHACMSRRERGSRSKNSASEQESVFSRRRRRIPSSSSNTSSPLTDDAMRYNISPPTTPTTKSSGGNNSTNEVLLASLKLPVQMINTAAIQVDVHTATASPLNLTSGLTSDLSDIPYIEDAETNNGYRSSSITSITPQQQPQQQQPQQQPQPPPITQSKSLSAMTKKSGFPLTKLKSQFKPAQLTLSAVPIDQGTKDVDKQTHSAGGGGNSTKPSTSNTIETKPHSVPMMTGT